MFLLERAQSPHRVGAQLRLLCAFTPSRPLPPGALTSIWSPGEA